MKTIAQLALGITVAMASAQVALAQATITAPSTWTAGQPTTVIWTGAASPVCAGGVRVTLNLGSTKIQTGTAVPMSAGRATIPGATLSAGTPVSLTLTDQCTGKVVSSAHAVTITGGTAAVAAVAPPATPAITPQITQNIDNACVGVLGAACSTSASYNSIYTAITQQIKQGSLKSDSSTVMYSYLIPMVQSSASWKANVVDNAWRGAGCSGAAPESVWTPKVAQLQTYQAVVNAMKQQGCAAAGATVAAAAGPATQYVPAQQMSAAYTQIWGGAAGSATMMTNCPVATGAVSCARSQLAAYVASHNTGMLISVAAANYQAATGTSLDSAHAQTLEAAFGRNWTGADDVRNYIAANPNLFPVSRVFGGLSAEGCLIDNLRIKLDANEPCGMYFLDANGAHASGSYAASFQGRAFTLSTANTGGILVSNTGVPLKIVSTGTKWAIGTNIVAQGGGNIILNAGGNIVAQGGGNIVAQGGGNIVAQGGGNIVAQGGGNLINDGAQYLKALIFTDPSTAARTARLITPGGASVISNDGGSFLPNINQIAAVAKLIGEDGSSFAVGNGAGILAAKPGAALAANTSVANPAVALKASSGAIGENSSGVIGENSSGIIGFNGSGVVAKNQLLTDNGAAAVTYSAQSVSDAKAAVMTGPATWTYGQPAMITWTPMPGTAACASGYRVLINGTTPAGNAVTLTLGKSLLQPGNWPRGTRLSISLTNLCTGAPAAAPYTTTVQ